MSILGGLKVLFGFAMLILLAVTMSCSTVNLADTVAGGACGTVDYRITFLGTPLFGIQAERECVDD